MWNLPAFRQMHILNRNFLGPIDKAAFKATDCCWLRPLAMVAFVVGDVYKEREKKRREREKVDGITPLSGQPGKSRLDVNTEAKKWHCESLWELNFFFCSLPCTHSLALKYSAEIPFYGLHFQIGIKKKRKNSNLWGRYLASVKVWHRFSYHIWSARICIKSADFRENCRAASVRTFPAHDSTESRVCYVVRLTCSVLLIQRRNSRLFSLTNIQTVVVSLPRLAVSASVAARRVGMVQRPAQMACFMYDHSSRSVFFKRC